MSTKISSITSIENKCDVPVSFSSIHSEVKNWSENKITCNTQEKTDKQKETIFFVKQ
jgi:hypothetical protein